MKRLITLTIVKNEEKRFLKEFLEALSKYSDYAVMLDNGSTDKSKEMMSEWLKNNKGVLLESDEDFKVNESKIRGMMWDAARKEAKEGDWIYVVDADEIPMDEFVRNKENLMDLPDPLIGINFRKIELWNDKEYRIDSLWSNYFYRMFKFKDLDWGWENVKGLHCPALPEYAMTGNLSIFNSNIRIKHLAYCTPELRKEKFEFMKAAGNPADKVNYNHLLTIESNNPRLLKLNETIVYDKTVDVIVTAYDVYSLKKFIKFFKTWTYPMHLIRLTFLLKDCQAGS
jgi:hypothetical protein